MRSRPAWLLALFLSVSAGAAVTTVDVPAAQASVSIAVLYDRLLLETTSAVVATPAEQQSYWEDGRIYTYTRVHVDRTVAGDPSAKGYLASGADGWVRTMGGVVGKVGQVVDGEPVLTVGRPALLFLHPGPPGAFEVTARAQGQFPVVLHDDKLARFARASGVGTLLPPKDSATVVAATGTTSPRALTGTTGTAAVRAPVRSALGQSVLAADVIHGRPVDDVLKDVAVAWKRVHGQ